MRTGLRATAVLAMAATVLVADLATVIVRAGGHDRPSAPVAAARSGRATEARADEPPTTVPKPTTTAKPTTTTAAPTTTTTAPPPPPGRPGAWTLGPYEGTGAWLDVFDWTAALTNGHPKDEVQDIWHMGDLGVQTLYIQTSYEGSPDIAEEARLRALIQVAHARGMDVVGWYLPTLSDLTTDFRKIMAASTLPIDGLAIDIESRYVSDPAARSAALLTLSNAVRSAMGTRAIGAITPSPVQIQVVNPRFWPGFPWPQLAQLYNVMLPMSYWSDRLGIWHSGANLIGADIDRIRASTGRADMPIHAIGGIANLITLDDLTGMIQAIQSRHILGGSLYDWNTSVAAQWSLLRALHVA